MSAQPDCPYLGVTVEDLTIADRFHYAPECNEQKTQRWRRNGQTKVWKTRPGEFRIPIKYGLRDYHYITQDNAHLFHTEKDCPYGHR